MRRRYPGFCTKSFEMLQCRTVFPEFESSLGKTNRVHVLRVDFSVDCDSSVHTMHRAVAILFIAVAAALPVYVIRRLRLAASSNNESVSHCVAADLHVDVEHARDAITNLMEARSFSFITAGLSSEYMWWEVCASWQPTIDGLASAQAWRTRSIESETLLARSARNRVGGAGRLPVRERLPSQRLRAAPTGR